MINNHFHYCLLPRVDIERKKGKGSGSSLGEEGIVTLRSGKPHSLDDCLKNLEQFHVEDEGGKGWDGVAGAVFAIG